MNKININSILIQDHCLQLYVDATNNAMRLEFSGAKFIQITMFTLQLFYKEKRSGDFFSDLKKLLDQ